jgi:hypothetical protein
MLFLAFFCNATSHGFEITFFGSLGTVFGLRSFVKGILLTLELSFLVLVVLLSFGVSIILLLNHLLKRSGFRLEDVKLSLDVHGFFHWSPQLIGPQFSKVFESFREVRDVVYLLQIEFFVKLVLHRLLREDSDQLQDVALDTVSVLSSFSLLKS